MCYFMLCCACGRHKLRISFVVHMCFLTYYSRTSIFSLFYACVFFQSQFSSLLLFIVRFIRFFDHLLCFFCKKNVYPSFFRNTTYLSHERLCDVFFNFCIMPQFLPFIHLFITCHSISEKSILIQFLRENISE